MIKGKSSASNPVGCIWDIKRFALHDGPGIRTTVFFKGCTLRCKWCCNPESQNFHLEIFWMNEKCIYCDQCLAICPEGAIQKVKEGRKKVDYKICNFCSLCIEKCPVKALQQVGRTVTVDEVLLQVSRDAVFHYRSDGGLTLSGGEPLAQPDFAYHLLRRYKIEENGLSTSLETCGYAEWETLSKILEYTDLVLYDIKHMDPDEHRKLTGVSNELILKNAIRTAESKNELIIRFPLIPGYNDSEENITNTSEFVCSLKGVEEMDILPYHRLGEPKYSRLGRDYLLKKIAVSQERLNSIQRIFKDCGLRVKIGG